MEAQVVLDGVGGVEDGPVGTEHQDKAVEGLERWRDNNNTGIVFTKCTIVIRGSDIFPPMKIGREFSLQF